MWLWLSIILWGAVPTHPDAPSAPLAAMTAPAHEFLAPAADSFPHRRHASLACVTCHDPHSGSRIRFERPAGCRACHHQAPGENRCPTCHQPDEIAAPRPRIVTVAIRGTPPRPRTVGFRHGIHAALSCLTCHTQELSLEPGDSVLACAACHDDHHQARRNCGGCHTESAAFAPHAPPAKAHAGCDACHATRTIARLVPDRGLCLTCHVGRRDHGAGNECTSCHFLEAPASYRQHLIGRS